MSKKREEMHKMKLHWNALDMESNLQPLKQCNQKKIDIAAQCYELYQLFSKTEKTTCLADAAQKHCLTLLEDRFRCIITGENNKDTDSVLNALLGQKIYNAAAASRMDMPVHMQYGTKQKVILTKTNSIFPQEKAIEDLPIIITQKYNSDTVLPIESIRVELPVPMLRNSVIYTYVPCLKALTAHLSQPKGAEEPLADLLLVVHSSGVPLTEAEMTLLQNCPKDTPLLLVLPQHTYTSGESGEKSAARLYSDIQKKTNLPPENLLWLFPEEGLLSKKNNNNDGYIKSQLAFLEKKLAALLSFHKTKTLITQMETEIGPLQTAARKYDHISDTTSPPAELPKMKYEVSLEEILAECADAECPLCQHLEKVTFDYYANFQYLFSKKPEIQLNVAQNQGFCNLHTWQLLTLSSTQGFSTGYAVLLEKTAESLYHYLSLTPLVTENSPLQTSPSACAICHMLDRVETNYLNQLALLLQTPVGFHHYQQSQGLCLPHLRKLVPLLTDQKIKMQVVTHAAINLTYTAQNMKTFALKHALLQRDTITDEENSANSRAVIHIVGQKDILIPQNQAPVK
jgi:hypothetical protein